MSLLIMPARQLFNAAFKFNYDLITHDRTAKAIRAVGGLR